MLRPILPYDSEPIGVSSQTPVACEVWFVEEVEESPPAESVPAYLLPDLFPTEIGDFLN